LGNRGERADQILRGIVGRKDDDDGRADVLVSDRPAVRMTRATAAASVGAMRLMTDAVVTTARTPAARSVSVWHESEADEVTLGRD
jgi:hypothetical protein